ncbi:MAG: carotenoid oxygenase family protein [Caulobacteraceae bacterium]
MAELISENDPLISGAFEPVREEMDRPALEVEGRLPSGLNGTFYRIGPNPRFRPRAPYNPLNGDGMIHAFQIAGGRARYLNRWVRTVQWRNEDAAGRGLFGTSGMPHDRDESVIGLPTDGAANTSLVSHAGRFLALEEAHGPIAIDARSLETLGRADFGGLPRNFIAHPKIDPVTGEMIGFANFPTGRLTGEVGVYRIGADGRWIAGEKVTGPFAGLIHDFAITEHFIILPFCPVTASFERAMAGGPPMAWEPGLGTHLGVIRRDGSVDDIRWFEGPAGMAWHVMNAFDADGRVEIDVCLQDAAVFPLADGGASAPQLTVQRLARWTFDWDGPRRFEARAMGPLPCEYPRIDERRTGRPYRHGFLAAEGGPGTSDLFHRAIARFDRETGAFDVWRALHSAVGEPVFAARPGSAAEGDGWLLAVVYDEETRLSHLAVFEALDVAAGPVARVHAGVRIPMGFHGCWRDNGGP